MESSNGTINVSSEVLETVIDGVYGIVDERDLRFFSVIGMSTIGTAFATFGVISNIMNIVVFVNIGFKDSINISLFALAISDLLSCLTMFPGIVGTNPYMDELGEPIIWLHIAHALGGWTHVAFAKITTLITAFITVERCLCVFMPLKVKTIVTRKRVVCFLVSIYLIVGILLGSLLYSNQLGWTFSPAHNRTILGLVFPKERDYIEKVCSPILNVFIAVFGFVVIIISTIVLVVTLKKKAEWRLSATRVTKQTASSTDNNVDTKEQRISKMVAMISTLFIASFFPSVILLLLLVSDSRFDFGGIYINLFRILISSTYILETLNSSVNIFIYYKNSSNYKAMFDQIFRSGQKTKP